MTRSLKEFMFSGLMTAQSVRDMEASGLLRGRAATSEERRDQDLFAPVEERIRAGAVAMQRSFAVLFVLENFVRELISTRFREEDETDDWFETRANSDMKKKLEQRKKLEEKNQWHTGRNQHPIFYMDFGDLSRLIINNWSVFQDFLPSQSWVQSRLDEAERSRNVIAHTNVLAAEEAERLVIYLRDWIKQVG